ncbi:MAG: hypothetical protein M0Z59_01645 [Nitrospiraceae bacterium]|nr:hypothetical protein [Nitrospiraceae bacterium]
MLTLTELREIAAINPDTEYYVTLYLNVDPVTNPRGEYMIRVRNMLKETPGNIGKKVYKAVARDLEKIDSYFVTGKRQFKKSVCLMSSAGKDFFWREYHLSVPVKSEIYVEKTPYLEPLFNIFDNYPAYLALLVSKEDARIFVVRMGEIIEYGEVHTPDITGRHSKGGWFALEQDHYERHTDFHVGLHMGDVALRLEEFARRQNISALVIGGPEESMSMSMAKLPKGISEKIIGTFAAGMYESPDDVLKKADPVIREHEQKEKQRLIEELITRVYKNKQAVLGIEDVILMTEEQRIQTLLVDADYRQQPGYFCANCRAMSLSPGSCRYCGGNTEEVNYMVDLVMQKTAEQGGKIEVVPGSEKLKNAGRIGALLRF